MSSKSSRGLPMPITIKDPDVRKRLLKELQPCLKYTANAKGFSFLGQMTPLSELPIPMDPYSGFTAHRVPVLRCGYPLTFEKLLQLMRDSGCPTEELLESAEDVNPRYEAAAAVYVAKQVGWDTKFVNVFGVKHGMLIALYHNYTRKDTYPPNKVVEALRVLLDGEGRPKWYLDVSRGNWDWHLR